MNPYTYIGTTATQMLDYIIANLPPNPSFDDLNQQLLNSVIPPGTITPPPGPDNVTESFPLLILPYAYNAIVNASALHRSPPVVNAEWNETQFNLLKLFAFGTTHLPEEAMHNYFLATENKLAASTLTQTQQDPLWVASALTDTLVEYFRAQAQNSGPWQPYLQNNHIRYPEIASAALQGALTGYYQVNLPAFPMAPVLASVIGAAGTAAGKVLFNWVGVGE